MSKNREWLVVELPDEQGDVNFDGSPLKFQILCARFADQPNTLYRQGRRWTMNFEPETMKILESYGEFSVGSQFEENIERAFYQKYREPHKMQPEDMVQKYKDAPEGWIDPEGNWYPVCYGGHSDAAGYIVAHMYKDGDEMSAQRAQNVLYADNWFSIHSGYFCNDGNDRVYSKAQHDLVLRLRQMATSNNWIANYEQTKRKVGL